MSLEKYYKIRKNDQFFYYPICLTRQFIFALVTYNAETFWNTNSYKSELLLPVICFTKGPDAIFASTVKVIEDW